MVGAGFRYMAENMGAAASAHLIELPVPQPGPDEVLVPNHLAAGILNPAPAVQQQEAAAT